MMCTLIILSFKVDALVQKIELESSVSHSKLLILSHLFAGDGHTHVTRTSAGTTEPTAGTYGDAISVDSNTSPDRPQQLAHQ